MDIMRLLTKKLKSQSLNDEQRRHKQMMTLSDNNSMQQQPTDCDSGTASDGDETESKEEEPLHAGESFHEDESLHARDREIASFTLSRRGCPWMNSSQVKSTEYKNPEHFSKQQSTSHDVTKLAASSSENSALKPATATFVPKGIGLAVNRGAPSGRLSAVSSDFERCSLDDFDLSNCSSEMDLEESSGSEEEEEEEELAVIYREDKRKRRLVVSHTTPTPDSSGCDESAAEYSSHQKQNCDHRFKSSSPSGDTRPRHCFPCKSLSTASYNCYGQKRMTSSLLSASSSSKKRCRHSDVDLSANSSVQQRPSLDLYKMQKTSIARKYNCYNHRPRALKIKTMAAGYSRRPIKNASYNPSLFCFRSISLASNELSSEAPFVSF